MVHGRGCRNKREVKEENGGVGLLGEETEEENMWRVYRNSQERSSVYSVTLTQAERERAAHGGWSRRVQGWEPTDRGRERQGPAATALLCQPGLTSPCGLSIMSQSLPYSCRTPHQYTSPLISSSVLTPQGWARKIHNALGVSPLCFHKHLCPLTTTH